MNSRRSTGYFATVAVLATLAVILLVVVVLIFTDVIPRGSSESLPKIEHASSDPFGLGALSDGDESDKASDGIEEKEVSEEENTSDQTKSEEPAESYDQATTMYVANVKNSIYLRSEPVENESNIITTIPVGVQVLWLENTNTVFSKITYNGLTGYVKRDYLSAKKPQQNTVSSNTTVYKYVYVANVKNSIYLRSAPQENPNNIITTIPVGTMVGYIERTDGVFSKIKYNGTVGYAKSSYLSDSYSTGYQYLTVYNVKHSIYLRSAPQENPNNIICEIPLGAVVQFISNAGGGFYKISYNGYTGYSKSMYLR